MVCKNIISPFYNGWNFFTSPCNSSSYEFAVFNRSGQRIFYSTDPSAAWDGTLNGRPQDTGVYVWTASGIAFNGQRIERNGTVILIR